MQPRLSVLTLGVDDLERAVEFYRDGLGWPTEGIVGQEFADGAVAFFDLQPRLKLALFPRRSLAKDAGLGAGTLTTTAQSLGPTDFSLGHNVRTRDEVDTLLPRRSGQVRQSSSRRATPSGVATPDIFAIRTSTCGKSSGIRTCCRSDLAGHETLTDEVTPACQHVAG